MTTMTAPEVSTPVDVSASLPVRAGAQAYQRRALGQIDQLVIHHTDARAVYPTAEEVAAYQTGATAHLPFPSIAYAVYVERDGRKVQTAPLDRVTWHCGQAGDAAVNGVSVKNWRSVAVCFSGDEPNAAQIAGVREACRWIEATLGRALPRLGHKDVSSTECPGKTWGQWRGQIA